MAGSTLYMEIGRAVGESSAAGDRGRTERTAAKETIDNDRARLTLYSAVGGHVTDRSHRGRTLETKAGGETVDRDRHAPGGFSALLGGDDLYGTLASSAMAGGDRGRTAITESTETLDWDRSPTGPRG